MTTVDLTHFFPWTFLLHLVRALIAFNTSHTILENKYNTPITFFSVVGSTMLYSYLTLLMPLAVGTIVELLVSIFYYVIVFAALCFVTKGTVFQKFLASLLSLVNYMLSALAHSIAAALLFGKSAAAILSQSKVSLLIFFSNIIFVFPFSFIFIALIKYIKLKTHKSFNYKKKNILIFLFPVTLIFSSWSLSYSFSVVSNSDQTFTDGSNLNFYIILMTMLSLIIDFSIIFIVDHFEKIEEDNILKEQTILKNSMDYNQMLMLKREKQEFRKIKHDFSNIVTTAKGFIEIDKPEKALNILSNTNEDLMGLAGFSVCSNETINTVLYIKQRQAEKNNIKLDIEIDEGCAVLVDDYDLCRLLHNIIDNALNAVSSFSDGKYCKVLIEINNEKLLIKTENKFDSSQSKHNNKKSTEHGNGTSIINNIVSKYSGKYVCNQLNGIWRAEVLLNNEKLQTVLPEFGTD